MPEYHAMRALELVREAQSGRVSAQELAEYFLRRIERYDQSLGLNAVGELNPQALDEAKALEENASPRDFPLFGLPILVKDNIDVAGLRWRTIWPGVTRPSWQTSGVRARLCWAKRT